jgi:iron complex transport system substrate-binding protein
MRDLNLISGQIVDAAYKVHTKLGPGLLESVYETVLAYELQNRGLKSIKQHPIRIHYDNLAFDEGFRADLIVEDCIIVELKSVEMLAPVHSKQLLTYLKLLDYRIGLLINFGAASLKTGLKRVVHNYQDP